MVKIRDTSIKIDTFLYDDGPNLSLVKVSATMWFFMNIFIMMRENTSNIERKRAFKWLFWSSLLFVIVSWLYFQEQDIKQHRTTTSREDYIAELPISKGVVR